VRALHQTHHHRQCYGLTCDEFEALIARAGGVCEICGAEPMRLARQVGLCIEHTEDPFTIRGLVCHRCNAALRRIDSGEREPNAAQVIYLCHPFKTEETPA
jgi:hypothetical protein